MLLFNLVISCFEIWLLNVYLLLFWKSFVSSFSFPCIFIEVGKCDFCKHRIVGSCFEKWKEKGWVAATQRKVKSHQNSGEPANQLGSRNQTWSVGHEENTIL